MLRVLCAAIHSYVKETCLIGFKLKIRLFSNVNQRVAPILHFLVNKSIAISLNVYRFNDFLLHFSALNTFHLFSLFFLFFCLLGCFCSACVTRSFSSSSDIFRKKENTPVGTKSWISAPQRTFLFLATAGPNIPRGSSP